MHLLEFVIIVKNLKKHYIVVIEKAGAWRCRGGAILPVFVIRRLSNSVKIYFEYVKKLRSACSLCK